VDAINLHMDRIARMVEARRRFITDAAHQLRTPLAVLNTQAEYALRQTEAADMRPAVEAFHQSLGSAIRLTNQLLSLSRAESANGLLFAHQPVDLSPVARDLVVELLPLAARRQIDLGFEGEGSARVEGHPLLLREMIANLVDNALRYIPEGGTVTVALGHRPASGDGAGQVSLRVTDDGPGIPEAQRGNVFLRFFRLDTRNHQGSGLGLAIVREIVLAHGGEITLGDGPGGRGLEVEIRLPGSAGP
jgi:two-component system sensor histidine kinase TctE